MPKTRHLLIAIGTDPENQEIARDPIRKILRTDKEKPFHGSFCADRNENFKKLKGDGFAAAFLTNDFDRSASNDQLFLRQCLEWLVEGGDARQSRKISLICHGGGDTKVANHAGRRMEIHTIMKCICNAGQSFDGRMHASVAWDRNEKHCTLCKKKFSSTNPFKSGRHHCRVCGRNVCQKCCTKKSVSFALERKGGAAAAASSPTSWVCNACSMGGQQNLLSKVGVFRLLVCFGALQKNNLPTSRYVPENRQHLLKQMPEYGEDHYIFPKHAAFRHISGHSPRLHTRSVHDELMRRVTYASVMTGDETEVNRLWLMEHFRAEETSGKAVTNFLRGTVAGEVVTVLRLCGITGMKVTAATGAIHAANLSVMTNVKGGVWVDREYKPIHLENKKLGNLKQVDSFGSATELNFSDEKFYCIT